MEAMETAWRRAPDEGGASDAEESSKEEEEQDNEAAKVLKMLVKATGRPKVDIPMYEGNLNVEELLDCISSLNK